MHQPVDFANVTEHVVESSLEITESDALVKTTDMIVTACRNSDDMGDDEQRSVPFAASETGDEDCQLDRQAQDMFAAVVELSDAQPRGSGSANPPRRRRFAKMAAGLAASIVVATLALQLPGMQDWRHLPAFETLIEQVGDIKRLLA